MQSARADDGVFSPGLRQLTLGILLAICAFAVEGMGVVPALPTAIAQLHGAALFGWAFSAFMLAWIVGTVAGGTLADARGPRGAMALGLASFSAGLLLAGSAPTMSSFLCGRALQGYGGGAMIASAYVAIARGYADAHRPRMMALCASMWILPALTGPALSGAITQWFGWRWVFLGAVPLVAGSALLVLPPLRPLDMRRAFARSSRILWSLAAAAGASAIIAAPALGTRAASFALAGSGALVLAPALRALLPAGTFVARRGLPAGLLSRGLLSFAFFGTEAFVPRGASELRGAGPIAAGLALSAGALGWISASWLQERLEASHGPAARALRVRIGFLMVCAAIALVAVTLTSSLPLVLVPVAWSIGGAGIGLSYNAGSLICLAEAPEGQEGEVSGQLQLLEALCTAAGTGLGGSLLWALREASFRPQSAHGVVFLLTGSVALLGALLAMRTVVPRRP